MGNKSWIDKLEEDLRKTILVDENILELAGIIAKYRRRAMTHSKAGQYALDHALYSAARRLVDIAKTSAGDARSGDAIYT